MDRKTVLRQLGSTKCQCENVKGAGQSFCGSCYRKLSPVMQKDLYKRFGHGYEAAYETAVDHLKDLAASG